MIRSLPLYLLFVLFIVQACSPDSLQEEENVGENILLNTIDITLNGESPASEIRNLAANVGCGNEIRVSFDHWIETNNGLGYGGSAFSVSLTTKGDLLSLNYRDYKKPSNEYYSAYFTPTSTLQIEDFELIENEMVKFKIKGQIFKKTYNYFEQPEAIDIDADVDIREFGVCQSSIFLDELETSNNFIFHQIGRSEQDNDITYSAHATNGHHIEFNNFNTYFKNLPLGIYSFDETSISERIDFRKFTGVPRAFSYNIIPQEWIKYETSGNFEILERQRIDGELISKIRFSFIAKENGVIKYQFDNGVFETAN